MGVGVIYLIVLSVVAPKRIRDTGRVFIDEPEVAAQLGTAPAAV